MTMNGEVLAQVSASAPRRVMGVGMLMTVGAVLIYVALARPPSIPWLLFLVVVGLGALWIAMRMWNATQHSLELTETELRCSDGTLIAKVDDIEAVDRGFFAFKPSNGFLIRTRTGADRRWYPGLWWRTGNRIGVGGVTPGGQSKAMSEILAAILAQRSMSG